VTPERALLFVDGNNWYHGLKAAGVGDQMRFDGVGIAKKLVGPRQWIGTRYYIGQVAQGDPVLYANQRRFHDLFVRASGSHSIHFGRFEPRYAKNEAARELLEYLATTLVRFNRTVYRYLQGIGQRRREAEVWSEKAVDVMLAVDMVAMACDESYDVAYVLSADGDYTTHAVDFVRGRGKKVFAVSASHGAQLAARVNTFIKLDAKWFDGLYL